MKKFNKQLATVICKDGYHHVILPSGEILPAVILTRVTDAAGDLAEVLVKMHVNITTDQEEAKRLYETE